MVTVEDVNGALKAALDGIGAALPGGGWSGAGPETPTYPYAMFAAEVTDNLYQSGPLFTQWWRATIAVYIPVGWSDAVKPQDTVKAVWNATAVAGCALGSATFRNAGDRVLHSVPADAKDAPSPVAHQGRDVLVATVAVELMVQSDRSVP